MGPAVYARWRASELGAITERLERKLVLDLAGGVRGQKILDIGCGDGDLAIEFAKRGATVNGIDVSTAMVGAAKEHAERENVEMGFEVGAADRLPFGPERFDLVTAITILCFIDDASAVFREIAHVLRPGGRLVIGELGKWSSWAAGRRIRAWLGSPLWRRGHFRTAHELSDLSRQAGLEVEQERGAIYYPRCDIAARYLSRYDAAWSRLTTIGAGFIAISAVKPPT